MAVALIFEGRRCSRRGWRRSATGAKTGQLQIESYSGVATDKNTTLLNAHGNPIKHYGDLDLEMSRKKLDQMGAIKRFMA